MKRNQLLSAVGIMLFVACSLAAQEKPGTLAALEFQKPKNGMVPQYEAGRKQKAAWHKQQNDPQPLLVWETLSGDSTGTYLVGRFGQHWADFDKPAIPDEADLAQFQKVVGAYVDSVVARYYEFLPRLAILSAAPPGLPSSRKSSSSRCATGRARISAPRSTASTRPRRRRSGPSISIGTRWRTADRQESLCYPCHATVGRLRRQT